jgi:hypothetical protein
MTLMSGQVHGYGDFMMSTVRDNDLEYKHVHDPRTMCDTSSDKDH